MDGYDRANEHAGSGCLGILHVELVEVFLAVEDQEIEAL